MKLILLTISIYLWLLAIIDVIRFVVLYRKFRKEMKERDKDA